ncbi:uncharacterized protein Z519_11261 [Cladophialophora bantiana CBS 173.52]|uniref:Uncharacterized protein n=1 Tax=Cladophialophora bantiana (strain ATCC 10958 / CBS 173.52 / CDC B-1940 / NIH 8579) TaxID=1442370 RepID=A0A0D2HB65_CLAB1|nr:uncharacterized protein Z519_11261 [Cladophialophora bantiana CBS 173.52]KIW88150.1 hypothetical protein Z519_11261 [Cladophialophora bantiana CBS 173.52]
MCEDCCDKDNYDSEDEFFEDDEFYPPEDGVYDTEDDHEDNYDSEDEWWQEQVEDLNGDPGNELFEQDSFCASSLRSPARVEVKLNHQQRVEIPDSVPGSESGSLRVVMPEFGPDFESDSEPSSESNSFSDIQAPILLLRFPDFARRRQSDLWWNQYVRHHYWLLREPAIIIDFIQMLPIDPWGRYLRDPQVAVQTMIDLMATTHRSPSQPNQAMPQTLARVAPEGEADANTVNLQPDVLSEPNTAASPQVEGEAAGVEPSMTEPEVGAPLEVGDGNAE